MILRNARLGDTLVDVRIVDGTIVELGAIDEPGTDVDGRWLLPGLWDQHAHFGQWAMHRQRVDLSGAASAVEAARTVAAAQRPPAGVALVGGGFRAALWPDEPTAALLDAAVRDVTVGDAAVGDGTLSDFPVVLISADLHSCWLNSAALNRFGFAGSGGLLREDDCFAVVRALDDIPTSVLDGWVRDAGRAAAARGLVGVVDLEMSWTFDDWVRRRAGGFDSLRVRAGVYPQFLDRAIADGLHTGDQLGDLLEVGPFKIITDGSLNTRTAYCVDEYPGMPGYRGMLTVQPDELSRWLRRATDAGLVSAVHAIGDRANTLALDAFEAIGCRGRIEHAQLLSTADLPRFAELGVAASVQPEHAMDDRDVADAHWGGRTHRAFVLRSLLDAGAELLLGSDAPVAPLDPWVTIAAAVGRDRGGEPWHPEQRISFDEALAASVQSSVRVGEPADLVLVDRDPWAADSTQLREMPVAATLLAGRFTHTAL